MRGKKFPYLYNFTLFLSKTKRVVDAGFELLASAKLHTMTTIQPEY
jgi:hypothetical protein